MKVQYLIFKVENEQGIMLSTLDDVEKKIRDKKGELLYLIIQSNGGYPFSAVRIMSMLQNRFEKIYSIIPSQAMSAATLMALGTDVIYMDDKSSLGPLDLPIEHPKDGTRISALDVQNTITTISSLVESIAEGRFEFLRNKQVSKSDAAKFALENSTKFLQPVVEQIDPYHLQKSYRELRIGLFCAYDLLLTRMMKNDYKKAIATARALVNNYPSHDYTINANEAKKMLNLNVQDLTKLEVWQSLRTKFEVYSQSRYTVEYGEMDVAQQQPLPEPKITKATNTKSK